MKNLTFTAFLFALVLTAFQCEEDKPGIYDNCCGAQPTSDTVQMNLPPDPVQKYGHIFIPNIFIPAAQGGVLSVDNLFLVFGNENVLQVVSMKLTDQEGAELFTQYNAQPNDTGKSWDGQRPDGTFYTGAFDYEVRVEYVDGQKITYTGSACAVACDDPAFPAAVLPKCFFPNQNNGQGGPDPSIPKATDCF